MGLLIYLLPLLVVYLTAQPASPVDPFPIAFSQAHGGCSAFENVFEHEYYSGTPFGQSLDTWTHSDVDALLSYGMRCLAGGDQLDTFWFNQRVRRLYAAIDKAIAERPAQIDSDAQCVQSLHQRGWDYDWNSVRVMYPDAENGSTLSQYLCLFLRQNALQSFSMSGPDDARALIGGIDLHFQLKKMVSTDDFFAEPSVQAPGKLWFSIVDVTSNGQTTQLHGFEDSLYLGTLLVARFGAPMVQ